MNFNKYDLIKLPHHGKYNKELNNLLKQTKPKYVIITNNLIDYDTINLLNDKKIKYFLTNNKITVSSDGNEIITVLVVIKI